jgi:lipoprotein signal peptidase
VPRRTAPRQSLVLLAITALVVVTDQAAKWWAWRHLGTTVVNEGGFIVLGRDIRAWFARPGAGAAVNGVGLALIGAGAIYLVRKPRRSVTLAGGALIAAGWLSNVLDRIGLHDWSAPGSRRGVVDFIPTGGTSRCNVADAWIAVGLLLLAAALVRRHRRIE